MRMAMVGPDGVIANIIEAEDDFVIDGFVLVSVEEMEYEIGGLLVAGVYTPPEHVPPVIEVTVKDYSDAIQIFLDETARQRQYEGILAAVSYRGDPNPRYAAEAETLFVWRSAVWSQVLSMLEDVNDGLIPPPSIEAVIASLPAFVWPS